jgi:hypothetical protein
MLKLRDAITGNFLANWQEGYCFIVAMLDLIQPE